MLTLWTTVLSLDQTCPVRRVITYNTALLDHSLNGIQNNRIERLDAIIQAIEKVDADLVCLQEVWIGQDVERMTHALKQQYPYSFSKIHVGGVLPSQELARENPPCDTAQLSLFIWCASDNKCMKKKPEKTFQCLQKNCFPFYVQLPQKCITCVVATMNFLKPFEIFPKCAYSKFPTPDSFTVNEPGLLLLSKLPIAEAGYTEYHPKTRCFIERGYLEANMVELGKVVCTHNTHYPEHYFEMDHIAIGTHASYLEQGIDERNQLIRNFGYVAPLIILGDFNVGGATGPFINDDLPEEFDRLCLYFDILPATQCSLCWPHENPYNKIGSATLNVVVDHIFFKGLTALKTERVITPHEFVLPSLLPLSNHNGVMTTLKTC
ncbi:hypothetical protein DPMN_008382 [Dreissena polymorpha]|uniref:sphingomyelin phosphodiesterase n=1 Tax=Dreissena polymorpha TaxID=45954 RepID=A0A9D4MZ53_DREPO|nr:hypothetical protein DPMN_008382 [Dreissena polymorpha]